MFPRIASWLFLAFAGQYPADWWTPIIDPRKPDWEILPQAAKPGEVILSKRNELGILSNFAATPFTLHGVRYASVEGFWQMMFYPEGPGDPRAQAAFVTWPGLVPPQDVTSGDYAVDFRHVCRCVPLPECVSGS